MLCIYEKKLQNLNARAKSYDKKMHFYNCTVHHLRSSTAKKKPLIQSKKAPPTIPHPTLPLHQVHTGKSIPHSTSQTTKKPKKRSSALACSPQPKKSAMGWKSSSGLRASVKYPWRSALIIRVKYTTSNLPSPPKDRKMNILPFRIRRGKPNCNNP